MSTKDKALSCFKLYLRDVMDPKGIKVERLRTDNDGVLTSKEFKEYLASRGIEAETSGPYMHESNGVAERIWRTLQDMALSYLTTAELPLKYWLLAFTHAAWIKNRLPHAGIDFEIPYERWTGRQPDLSKVRIFGCKAFALSDRSLIRNLDNRAIEYVYVGHDMTSNAYTLWDVPNNKIVRSGMVTFIEDFDRYGQVVTSETLEAPAVKNGDDDIEIAEVENVKAPEFLDARTWYQKDAGINHAIVLIMSPDQVSPQWVLASSILTSKEKHWTSFTNFTRRQTWLT
jgi:hypothetical protein